MSALVQGGSYVVASSGPTVVGAVHAGRLMALPDDVRVFPAHGAGSACGKNLSTERWSTIGSQRLGNYACQPMAEDEFVALVSVGQPPKPAYFADDALLNRTSHPVLDATSTLPPLDLADVLALQRDGAVVIDARDPQEFATAHLTGSLNIPADGRFAETAGTVVRPDQQIVLITPQGREAEIVVRLARIGLDRVAGHLDEPEGAFLTAPARITRASRLTARELAECLRGADPSTVIDVRNPGEVAAGTISGARQPHPARPATHAPCRRPARPADHRVLRGRLPVQRRGRVAAPRGLSRRVRPDRRIPGLDRTCRTRR